MLMDPPFVRATNHGAGRPDPVPPFAVRGIPPETQIEAGRHDSRMFKSTCPHGHAGRASHFMAICDRKVKRGGGRFGPILPDTFATGPSRLAARSMLAAWYGDVTVVAVGRGDEETHSADTLMREVVLVAQKRDAKRSSEDPCPMIKFVILDRPPSPRIEAASIATAIRDTAAARLEDGAGAAPIAIGDDTAAGRAARFPAEPGMPWTCRRAGDVGMPQFAHGLARGIIRAGGTVRSGAPENGEDAAAVPIAPLGPFAEMGRRHLDIIGTKKNGDPPGPVQQGGAH